mmetsp:Transcript_132204/g.229234  ORF Transcript_132204/g.229234 Transcript_132204/m.229234 type:complete len:83 (-) Transcript_132204:284-532(-)
MIGITKKLLGSDIHEFVTMTARGKPHVQAYNFWNMPYAKRRSVTRFMQGGRWPFLLLFFSYLNFKNRDDSHLLRRGIYDKEQ